MRALRLSLVGTFMVALLGGPSGAVLAQDEAETPTAGSAVLDFTVAYGHAAGYPRPSVEEGRNAYRDYARFIDLYETGDPRLSGQLWLVQNSDTFHDSRGSVAVGVAGMDFDDAAWRGTFRGYGRPGMGHSLIRVDLSGEDAYEGLSAMLFLDRDEATITQGNRGTYDIEGIIFPGEFPPMPDMPD